VSRENEQRDWKLNEFGDCNPTQIEWAMMAAYIDGEGSICIQTRGRHGGNSRSKKEAMYYLMVQVANTDVRLVVWIIDKFGGSFRDANTVEYNQGRNVKRCWHWTASSNRAAWILHNCLPYFVIKKEQADIGISLQETMLRNRGQGKFLPDEIVNKRQELKTNLLRMKKRGRVEYVPATAVGENNER
jgi:hypothetical protein